jgi:hypothetical protein
MEQRKKEEIARLRALEQAGGKIVAVLGWCRTRRVARPTQRAEERDMLEWQCEAKGRAQLLGDELRCSHG